EHTEELWTRPTSTEVSERDEMTDVALRAAELVAEPDFVGRGILAHVTDQSGLVRCRATAIVTVAADPLLLDRVQRADATTKQPWPLVQVALEFLKIAGPAALELARDVTLTGRPPSSIASSHRS